MVNKRFWRRRRRRRGKCLWIKRWITCEVFVRFSKTYAQKNSRILVFVIAALHVLLHASLRYAKASDCRVVRSLGWASVCPGALCKRGAPGNSRNPRAIASRRGRQSFDAECVSRGFARAGRRRDGRPGVSRQDPPSGRSALFPAQGGGSGRQRLVLGATLWVDRLPKGALGLVPGAIRGLSWGAAGRLVEGRAGLS